MLFIRVADRAASEDISLRVQADHIDPSHKLPLKRQCELLALARSGLEVAVHVAILEQDGK